MKTDLHIGLIYGSTRAGRRCDTVAGWAIGELSTWSAGTGAVLTVDAIDPAEPRTGDGVTGGDAVARAALAQRLERCDAFIVVVPEYNHSFPAPLKALIDSFKDEWAAKPVAFVSYGGISGGLRAVEHLRHVFAELHAVGIRDGVSLANIGQAFDDDGALRDGHGPARAMALMIDRLSWWALALKAAREDRPYGSAAA